jgi:hypothetical protein
MNGSIKIKQTQNNNLIEPNGWQYEKCRIQRTNLSNFK